MKGTNEATPVGKGGTSQQRARLESLQTPRLRINNSLSPAWLAAVLLRGCIHNPIYL